jgi:ferric-dicitrate binding protein FerR (iron transport regulator)
MNIRKITKKYFDGELPAALAKRVRSWLLHGKGENEERERALREAWERIVEYREEPSEYARASYEELRERLSHANVTGTRKMGRWKVAAALLPFLAGGTVTWMMMAPTEKTRVVVEAPAGETRCVALPDGSEVVLNAGGKITYDTTRERTATLDGEALFKVTKGEKPFVVTAGEVEVTVLGTVFNMEVIPASDMVKISLFEGKVKLHGKHGSHLLHAGEELIYHSRTGAHERRRLNESTRQTWHEKEIPALSFTTFGEILERIATRYSVEIHNLKPELNEEVYTFLLDESDSLDEALHILQLIDQRFTYRIEDRVVFIE